MKLNLENISDKILFKKLLSENIITFEYVKLDGKKRNSRGTLHLSYIPKDFNTTITANKSNNAKPEQVTYWDFTVNGWRSPRLVGQTIIIKNIEPLNKADNPLMKVNNRLYEIYEKREEIKRRIKEIKKDLRKSTKINVTYLGTLEIIHDVAKIEKIKLELEQFEEERKMLRREVERLQNLKYKLNFSKEN